MTAELLPMEVWSCLSAHTGLPGKKRLNEIQNLMARGDP
jgi:hypothetical protein